MITTKRHHRLNGHNVVPLTIGGIQQKYMEIIMKSNLYKFTVEHLEDSKGNTGEMSPLVFETRSHEDIFKIAEVMNTKMDLDQDDTAAFAVSLKLLGGVMMNNKENELFKQFMPHFRDFMKSLKKS